MSSHVYAPLCVHCGCRGRRNGLCDEWLSNASPAMQALAGTVNGPLLAELAQRIGHADADCVEFFRDGRP